MDGRTLIAFYCSLSQVALICMNVTFAAMNQKRGARKLAFFQSGAVGFHTAFLIIFAERMFE